MKKKLSILILSVFLLSTPCFAHEKFNPPHKQPLPPKYNHHIERRCNNTYVSDRTKNLALISGVAGVATIISSILD